MSTPSLTALPPAPGQSRGLRSITVARADMDPQTGLLDYVVRNDAHTWIRRGSGLVAYGETARFTVTGPDRFTQAQEWWRRELAAADVLDDLGVPGSGLIAFGSFAFSKTSAHESRLIVPEVVVGCSDGQTCRLSLEKNGPACLEARHLLSPATSS